MKKKPSVYAQKTIYLHYETAVEIVPVYEYEKAPGEVVHLRFISTFNNGMKLESSSTSMGRLNADHYTIKTTGGSYRSGKFYIEDEGCDGKAGYIDYILVKDIPW